MLLRLCYHADFPFRLLLADLRRQSGLDGQAANDLDEKVLDRPDLIAAAAQRRHDQLSAQRGRDRDNTLYLTVQSLVVLYEMTTGRRASYGRADDGLHASPAAGFIDAFFKEMEPELPSSRPIEALRHVMAVRRGAATVAGFELFTGT
jgi:hypothetical protein